MSLFKRCFPFLLLFSAWETTFCQLQIVPEHNGLLLAQKLVGSGVSISHIRLTGSDLSTAFFYNKGGLQLGIDSGIVLSTGRVLSAGNGTGMNGPAGDLASSQIHTRGDRQLSALVHPQTTNDAVVLEFDFIPVGDTVRFRYVFSSDEYPTYNCSNFNDVFAFFISGPGIADTQNIALVPGSQIPVAINSINNGIPGKDYKIGTCQAMGAGSPFTQYFVDNSGNGFFTHNGHTTVLTARAAVQPCQTYHLKIAIADVTDLSFDSGVFLEAESLKSDPIRIIAATPRVGGLPYLVEGCQPGGIRLVRHRKMAIPEELELSFGGTAVNGEDIERIPSRVVVPANDSQLFIPVVPITDHMDEGIEVLKIYVSNGCVQGNMWLDSVQIQLRDYDTISFTPGSGMIACRNSPVQLIASPGYTSYQWTPAATLDRADVSNPLAHPLDLTTYTCTAALGDCLAKDSLTVAVRSLHLAGKKDIYCGSGTGEIRVSGGTLWKQPVQYSLNKGPYGKDSVFANLVAGNYTVRILDDTGCTDSLQVALVRAYPDLVLQDSIVPASCSGTDGQIRLFPSGGKPSYDFALDGTYSQENNFTAASGSHTVSVKDANGCVVSHPVYVPQDSAIRFAITTGTEACKGLAAVTLYIRAAGGSGSYLYSMDGASFQAADSFLVTRAGNVTILVRDSRGCTAAKDVYVPLNDPVYVKAGNDTTICEGSGIRINALSNATHISWSPAASLSDPAILNPFATPRRQTTYYVQATRGICTVRDSITISLWPAPVANAGPDTTICAGRSIALEGSGGYAYSWLPASQVNDPDRPDPLVRPLTSTRYYLRVFDGHHCPSLAFDTVLVTVEVTVQPFAGRDTIVALGQPLQLHGRELHNGRFSVVQWSPARGLDNPATLTPVALPEQDMTYTLKMANQEGCVGTDDIRIKVFARADIYVPSAFSPDGNGRNDVLRAIPVGMKAFRYFRIYDRTGQLVFSTTTEKNGWDGRVHGKLQGTGSYVWLAEAVDYKGKPVLQRGVVTLIR